jgi:hypothetical protein
VKPDAQFVSILPLSGYWCHVFFMVEVLGILITVKALKLATCQRWPVFHELPNHTYLHISNHFIFVSWPLSWRLCCWYFNLHSLATVMEWQFFWCEFIELPELLCVCLLNHFLFCSLHCTVDSDIFNTKFPRKFRPSRIHATNKCFILLLYLLSTHYPFIL